MPSRVRRRALRWPRTARTADQQSDIALDMPLSARRGDDEGLSRVRRPRACAWVRPSMSLRRTAPPRQRIPRVHRHAAQADSMSEELRRRFGQHRSQPVGAGVPRTSASTSASAADWTADSATSRARPRKISSSDAVVLTALQQNRLVCRLLSLDQQHPCPIACGVPPGTNMPSPGRTGIRCISASIASVSCASTSSASRSGSTASRQPTQTAASSSAPGCTTLPSCRRGTRDVGTRIHGWGVHARATVARHPTVSPARRCHPARRRRARASRRGRF